VGFQSPTEGIEFWVAENSVILIHSEVCQCILGYSNVRAPEDPNTQATAVEIVDFVQTPTGIITARLVFRDAKPQVFKEHLKKDSEGKHFVSDAPDRKYDVTLERPDRSLECLKVMGGHPKKTRPGGYPSASICV